jgi:CPA1 family monovalent cation:H+ antiporter
MDNFTVVIFLMSILIALSAFSDKLKLPYPILLVLTGAVIGFIPALPDLALDPEVVFLVFLPPILHDAASHTSWHEFRSAIRPISTLAITLVFFTTTSVAIAAHYLIPGFDWPIAFVLGAIVSPPDAVAAASITKGLGLNKRVITILEGESLVNDASALIAYRYAVAAVATGSFVFWKASLEFLLVAGGGILVGIAVGLAFVFVHKKIINNALVETSLTLLAPFFSYLLAEHLHTSGVLAVVSAGLLISWRSPEIFSYQTRMQTKAVWDTVIFLLNGIIFILIGLQLPSIIKALDKYSFHQLLSYGLLISLVTILIRIVWVFTGAYHQKLFARRKKTPSAGITAPEEESPWKNVLIVAWTGTRGVVSLATALALPLTLKNGDPFPERDIILFLAFVVIFITLVVQGLTLPLLIRLLGVKVHHDPRLEERELDLVMTNRIIDHLEHHFPVKLEPGIFSRLKDQYQALAETVRKDLYDSENTAGSNTSSEDATIDPLLGAQLEIARFQRELLIKFHKEGTFSDEVIRRVEEKLDIEDLQLNNLREKEGASEV